VDHPQVLEHARPFLEDQGVTGRCTLHPGDLFTCPPPADMYLLVRVLHDWDDHHAARILTALRRSGRRPHLRILERPLPDDDTPDRAKASDVAMLLLFGGGRERTAGEYRALLDRAGWQLDRIVTNPGEMSTSTPAPQRPTDMLPGQLMTVPRPRAHPEPPQWQR
jgi:hypothetical protein